MTIAMEPPWPPQSPREALLSSPSGRKRYQNALNSRMAPLSPTKRSATTPNLAQSCDIPGDSEDDDEETLKLKLQAIEAKLKLKKLQQQRARANSLDIDNEEHQRPHSATDSMRSRPASRYQEEREKMLSLPGSRQTQVQVPLSPVKRATSSISQSPSKILGKDRRADEVSLGRAPSLRKRSGQEDPLPNARSQKQPQYGSLRSRQSPGLEAEPERKTFSERMAEIRNHEKIRQEKMAERQRNRNSGFQIDQEELERHRAVALETEANHNERPRSPVGRSINRGFSHDEVLRSFNQHQEMDLKRSNTTGGISSRKPELTQSGNRSLRPSEDRTDHNAQPSTAASLHRDQLSSRQPTKKNDDMSEQHRSSSADPTLFEPFSSFHLSKRILPHTFVSRTLKPTTPMSILQILRSIRHPDYDPPDCDGDFVLLGIVASKSTPKEQKTTGSGTPYDPSARSPKANGDANARNKYIVFTLTDLKYTIDLFLFSTAFNRYYRLAPGTVIAVLNPNILPPPAHKKDTHIFSLCLNSDHDTILEIGTSKDIGFCKAVRRDGKICDSWIDARHTDFCDFHTNLQLQKSKSGRMEVNSGIALFGPGGRRGGDERGEPYGKRSYQMNGNLEKTGRSLPDKGGTRYDRSTATSYFITPSIPRPSSGSRNHYYDGNNEYDDGNDNNDPFLDSGTLNRGQRQDRLRRRIADMERERDIAKKLAGSSGGGMGAEYLRLKHDDSGQPDTGTTTKSTTVPAASGSRETTTGAVKPAANSSTLAADGKRKAEAVKLSPVKKTRFMTAKGIREAGRDSFGVVGRSDLDGGRHDNDDDDDDDGLDIV